MSGTRAMAGMHVQTSSCGMKSLPESMHRKESVNRGPLGGIMWSQGTVLWSFPGEQCGGHERVDSRIFMLSCLQIIQNLGPQSILGTSYCVVLPTQVFRITREKGSTDQGSTQLAQRKAPLRFSS